MSPFPRAILFASVLSVAGRAALAAQTISSPGMAIGWTQPGPQLDARSCPTGRVPLMILGSYHMDNPGKDAVNLDADDVLSEKRQAEIEQTVARIGRFQPTKVAVEWPYQDAGRLASRYAAYLAGTYQLTRNEIDQLGFRVARATGLERIEAVDYPMYMNGMTPSDFENPRPAPRVMPSPDAAPRAAPARPPAASPAAPLSAEDQLLRRSTVSQYLTHLNSDTTVAANAAGYLGMLLPDSSTPALYARADLVTNWYKRNLRIFSNLARATAIPNARVLLVIGSGHLHILSDLALTSRYYCLVSPIGYLRAP